MHRMLYLHGMGHFHPENIITNSFIAELDIGSDEEWIMERVGIKERRTSLPLDYIRTTKNKDPREAIEVSLLPRKTGSREAALLAMERANLTPEDIGMVISGSCTSDHLIPAEASIVASELGIDAPCIDINSACSTFVVQLAFLAGMNPDAVPRYILVVNPETFTHVVDYSDKKAAPLFGDGFSAAIVSNCVPSQMWFESFSYSSTPASWEKVVIPQGGHFDQDGRAVQGYAIRKVTTALKHLQEEFKNEEENMKFIGHQANFMMLSHVCERCSISEDNHWYNVVDFGNTGSAGAPIVLSQNWDNLNKGDLVAMAVVGSGLTWGNTMLRVG